MRSSRLLTLMLLLQRKQSATAAALADELEVSVRTLYRDVAALTAAGVPLLTESGPGGGIRLAPGWRTELDGLTADEASALFLSGAPQAVSDLGLTAVALSARAKIDATLPPGLRLRAERMRGRFLLDAPGWFSRPEPVDALSVVADAVWNERRLDLRYGPRGARRRVDPLGLVLKAGAWYLVARHRGDVKSFRVSRIASAHVRAGEPCERPEGFSLSSWWRESEAAFDRSLLRYRCRVRLSPASFRALPRVVPNEAVRQLLSAAEPPDDEGWRAVELWLESEEVGLSQLVALGDGVEVLDPPPLRARLREVGIAIATRNRAGMA